MDMMFKIIYFQKTMKLSISDAFYDMFLPGVKRILNLLTISSLLIALTAFFQTLGRYILLDLSPNYGICTAAFLITFSMYSANKLTDIEEDAINRPDRIDFLEGKKEIILFLTIYTLILSVLIVYSIEWTALSILFLPFIANCVYSIRLHPALPRLKDIPFAKNIVVGLSWALGCTLMPVFTSDFGPDKCVILPTASVIYLMLVKDFINSTLCDVKDINGDRESGVQTIPVILGAKKTRRILLALNCTLLPLLILVQGSIFLIYSLLIFIEYIFVLGFSESSRPAVVEFFIDGEWLIICLLLHVLGLAG